MNTTTETTEPEVKLVATQKWIFDLLLAKVGTGEPVTLEEIMSGDSPFNNRHSASVCINSLASKLGKMGYVLNKDDGVGRSKILKLTMEKKA